MRWGKEGKKIRKFLTQSLQKDVANVQERLRGAPLISATSSTPRAASSTFWHPDIWFQSELRFQT